MVGMAGRPEIGQYHGIPVVVVPDGTAWWAGENSYYIDWSRDLRKDAVEGYNDTWLCIGETPIGTPHFHDMFKDFLPEEYVRKRLKEIADELEAAIFSEIQRPSKAAHEAYGEPLTAESIRETIEEHDRRWQAKYYGGRDK